MKILLSKSVQTCIQKASKTGLHVPHSHTHTRAHICPHRGGWQGAFQDSWWKPGVLWLLEGADSGDICASCCSAIVETLKVNYNINDSALQAVVPYYASIIPCMGTQRHREGIGPHHHLYKNGTSLWRGLLVYRVTPSTFHRYTMSPHGTVLLTGWLIFSLSISIPHFIFQASNLPPLTPPFLPLFPAPPPLFQTTFVWSCRPLQLNEINLGEMSCVSRNDWPQE